MSMSSYKRAFETARRKADVECRFYDARHTFITRLAENSTVSEETIRQLAGHVNPKMLGRYAHIRVEARRAAIATLERGALKIGETEDPPQDPPQSLTEPLRESLADGEEIEQNQGVSDPMVNSRFTGHFRRCDLVTLDMRQDLLCEGFSAFLSDSRQLILTSTENYRFVR